MARTYTVVITGANSGIGFETALHFAKSGARVVMACRSLDKAERAERRILDEVPNAWTVILPLDVSEMSSVRRFGQLFAEQLGELDVLINNAGTLATELARTSAGHELLFATNYLGAFALTGTLLPYFRKDCTGRVVNVGSLSHRFGSLDLDDLNWQRTKFDPWKAYANSKVATLNHTFELNRRFCEHGRNVIALAAHPGIAVTEIARKREESALRKWYVAQMSMIVPSAEKAARSIIRAASAADARGGDYYGPGGLFELGGLPARARVNPIAQDAQLGASLWTASEELSGVRYLSTSHARPLAALDRISPQR